VQFKLTPLKKFGFMMLVCCCAHAQSTYPQKSISIVVPYVSGGVSDALARALATKLNANLGQQVMVENKPGGNTLIGATHVAKSAPDGYTLLLTAESTLTMNPMLYAKLPYDVDKNFAPIVALASIPQSFVISPSVPAKNIQEFVQLAKKSPKHYSFANLGIGSSAHLNFELFQRVTQMQLVDIAYKGASAAITDLIGGHVSAMIVSTGLVSAQARANNLRVLAVAGNKRSSQLPDVPTFKEEGLENFTPSSWFALMGVAGTPKDVLDKLNAEINKILKDPSFKAEQLDRFALDPIGGSPEYLAAYIKSESQRWSLIIKDLNIKLD
jgi:tripartite-type tricarboxylate transporter receptor subunit TctC